MPVELSDVFPGLVRWVTVPVEGLKFPAKCCRCSASTEAWKVFSGSSRATPKGFLGQLAGVEKSLLVTVPMCEACQRAQRRYWLFGLLIGTTLGAALGVFGALALPSIDFDEAVILVVRVVIVGVGAAAGATLGGSRASRRDPVRLRNYSEREGTVQLWFQNPAYRAEVEALNDG